MKTAEARTTKEPLYLNRMFMYRIVEDLDILAALDLEAACDLLDSIGDAPIPDDMPLVDQSLAVRRFRQEYLGDSPEKSAMLTGFRVPIETTYHQGLQSNILGFHAYDCSGPMVVIKKVVVHPAVYKPRHSVEKYMLDPVINAMATSRGKDILLDTLGIPLFDREFYESLGFRDLDGELLPGQLVDARRLGTFMIKRLEE